MMNYMTWIMSVLTLFSMYLAGNRSNQAWSLSLFNQLLWLIYITGTMQWGLIPMNVGMWFISYRNYKLWKKG